MVFSIIGGEEPSTETEVEKMRPGIWQVVIVVMLIAVLFGAKKIPELARSLGKAKGEFKKGLAEGEKEDSSDNPVKEMLESK